jgi:hypothetical protein
MKQAFRNVVTSQKGYEPNILTVGLFCNSPSCIENVGYLMIATSKL